MERNKKWLAGFLLLSVAALAQNVGPGRHRVAVAAGPAVCINSPVCACVVVGSQQREFCTSTQSAWHATTNGANITVEAIGGGGGGGGAYSAGSSGNGGQGIVVITYTP